jgi:MFS family permease
VLVAVNLVDGTETSIVAGALPLLQDEWRFGDTLAGALPTAASLAGLAVTLPAGLLADRVNRVRLLTIVVASWALLTTVSAVAAGFWMFFAVRVVLGSANSLDNPSASSLITDFHPPRARSRVFAVQRAAWTVGASLGVALGGVLGESLGWRAPFLVMAVPGLVVAWCLSHIREPVRGGLDPPSARPVVTSERDGLGAQLRLLWSYRVLRAVYVGAVVAYLGFNGLGYWAPSLFEREFDLGEGTAAALTGVMGVTATVVGSAVGGILGDRWGGRDASRRVLLAGMGLAGGGAVVVVAFLVPVLVPQLLLLMVGAAAIVSAAPNFAAIIADVLPATRRGLGYAFFTFVIIAGGALGPLVIGALSELTGSLRLAFVVGMITVVPGGLGVLAARRHTPP